MPLIDRSKAQTVERQAYPGRLLHRTDGCMRTRLSDAAGLTQLGIGEVELRPGSATGLTHYHEGEDEFIYILDGEVTLVLNGEEYQLEAGDCAGFRAGDREWRTFENRSDRPARLLEISTRHLENETAHYRGLDMVYRRIGREVHFEMRDGRRLGPADEVAELPE